MPLEFGDHLNFGQKELQNAVIQNLSSDPGTPLQGQIWYRSDLDELRYYDGAVTRTVRYGGQSITSADIADGTIVNADISGSAAIAYSKLSLTGSIVNADIAAGAAIALSKLATDPLARANHTGTQLAATISDFNTAVRTNRLDQMALPTADVNFNSRKIVGLADGTLSSDAATWGQVQGLVNGVKYVSVRVASTANIAALSGLGSPFTIDGVTLADGDRVLLKNQTTQAQNGVYVYNGPLGGVPNTLVRAPDMDSAAEVDGKVVIVEDSNSTQAGTLWITTSEVTTLGTDAIAFTQFNSVADIIAGAGLTKTGTTLDVGAGPGITVNADTVQVRLAGASGLAFAGGGTQGLFVNVDDATVELTAGGLLRVKDGGIGEAKLVSEFRGAVFVKAPVRVLSAANINLASPGASIDGIPFAVGDRVYLNNQTTTAENGIWVWNGAAAAMTRPVDWAAGSTVYANTIIKILEGTFAGWTYKVSSTVVVNTGTPAISIAHTALGTGSVTGTLSVGNGGTGATTATGARTNLGAVGKYAETLSTSATSYVITHNLNTQDVTVNVRRLSDQANIITSWEATSVNTITVRFATAPTANTHRVVVTG